MSGEDEPNYFAVIGYPSGQYGAFSSARDYPLFPVRIIMFFFRIVDLLLNKLVRSKLLDVGFVFLPTCAVIGEHAVNIFVAQ